MNVLEPTSQRPGTDSSGLQESLSLDLSRKMDHAHKQLINELEKRMEVQSSQQQGSRHQGLPQRQSPDTGVSELIHSITDTKLHQMKLEMRQYLSARLDVLLEDVRIEQAEFERRLRTEMDQRFQKLYPKESLGARVSHLLSRIPSPTAVSLWVNVPISLTLIIMAVLYIVWPN